MGYENLGTVDEDDCGDVSIVLANGAIVTRVNGLWDATYPEHVSDAGYDTDSAEYAIALLCDELESQVQQMRALIGEN